VVIAVGAVFVAVFEFLGVFAETFFAFFAGECHVVGLEEGMGFIFGVAFGAVVPFFAAGGAD